MKQGTSLLFKEDTVFENCFSDSQREEMLWEVYSKVQSFPLQFPSMVERKKGAGAKPQKIFATMPSSC